jgi:SAM-dependent methyltransferase
MEGQYSGADILTALQSAEHYNDYLTNLIRRIASSEMELVDFGAGLGTFAKRLRQKGYRVLCIEPDKFQRQKLTDDGFDAMPSLDSLPDGSAGFVFSLNVFEHIENHSIAIEQIRQKLRPGGILLIYVPAFACLWSSLDDKVCHFRRYTKATLRDLVERAGFSVQELRYTDSFGFFAALVFRLLRRSAERLTPDSIKTYDRWIFPPSRILDAFLHPFFGKNVYVVAAKRTEPR